MKTRTAMAFCLILPMVAPIAASAEAYSYPTPHRVDLTQFLRNFNQIEPASGGAPAPAAEHGAPTAHGNSDAQKSFAGKEIGAPPPLPVVKIGGLTVARNVEVTRAAEEASTPPELQRRDFAQVLQNRMAFTPFAHSPHIGPKTAPITVVVFEDLACISCTENSKALNTALADVFATPSATVPVSGTAPTSSTLAGITQIYWVHTASARFQPNNLPAFYSKVAAQYGKFWEFRTALLTAPDREPTTLFTILADLGIEPRIIRQVMLTEARRYYRELDGDVLQSKSFGIGAPPTVLVNGIRVGQSGIPLSLLPDVLTYVHNRFKAGLNEPPL